MPYIITQYYYVVHIKINTMTNCAIYTFDNKCFKMYIISSNLN